MDEYNYLLNINNNLVDNDIDDITDNDIVNNKNELSEQFNDGFFKYIFDNINLSRRDDIKNSSDNSEESNVKETYTNTNIEKDEISSINILNKTNDNEININQENINQDNINQDKINQENINQENINQDNINQNNINQDNKEEDNIILNFIKKIYKKIIIKCHPDKGGDKSLFIKCQEYYDNKFLIGILYIGYKVNFVLPELNNKIIEQILYEIRIIQQKIIYMKLKLKKNINK
jgi:hypothetical protein